MGTFCIIIGWIIIALFAFSGYATACALVMPGFANVLSGTGFDFSQFFSLPTADNWYIFAIAIVIGILLGLQIGLGLVVSGMNYNKLNKLEYYVRWIRRKIKDAE